MSCSCCPVYYNHSSTCHRRQLVSNAAYAEENPCCSPTSYYSPSHRHLPSVASPLHITHPPHHSHSHHQLVDVYHTPQAHHPRMISQHHGCHTRSRRELIPSPGPHSVSPQAHSPGCVRPLPQTPPSANPTHVSSYVCSNMLDFSPMSSHGTPEPQGFTLAYSEEEISRHDEVEPLGSMTNISTDSRFKCLRKADRSCVRSYGKSKRRQHSVEVSDASDLTSRQKTRDKVPSPISCGRVNEITVVSEDKSRVTHKPIQSEDPVSDHCTMDIPPHNREPIQSEGPVSDHNIVHVDVPSHNHSQNTQSETIVIEDEEAPIQPSKTLQSSLAPKQPTKPAPLSLDVQQTEVVMAKADSSPEKSEKKAVVLVKWFFDIMPPDRVVLLGYKEQDLATSSDPELWRTGPIASRLSARLLQTARGTQYQLKGTIDQKQMGPGCEYGQSVSKTTARKFRSGFPQIWKDLLIPSEPHTKGVPKPAEAMLTPPTAMKREVKTEVKEEPSPFLTPSVLDSSIKSGFLSSLKRSSRGRTLKPSMDSLSPYLQSSTNIYSYDVYGNFKGFSTPIIDLTLSDVEDLTPKKAKKKPKKEFKEEEEEAAVQPIENLAPTAAIQSTDTPQTTILQCDLTPQTTTVKHIVAPQTTPVQTKRTPQTTTVKHIVAPQTTPVQTKRTPQTTTVKHIVAPQTTTVQPKSTPQTNQTTTVQPQEKTDRGKTGKYNLRSTRKKQTDSNNTEQPLSAQGKGPKAHKEQTTLVENSNSKECKQDTKLPERSAPKVVAEKTIVSFKPKTPSSAKAKRRPRLSMRRSKKATKPASAGVGKGNEKKGPELDREEEVTVDGWTTQQVTLLKRIVREVPALAPDFWEEVASRLPTNRTARECSTKYMDICTRPSTKKQKLSEQPDNGEGDKKILITAKTGTLKRKRQLRAAMEHWDRGYADDIFESTPFKKKVKTVVRVPLSESECEETSDESEEEEEEEEAVSTPNPARRRVGAPKIHTPKLCDLISTPDLKCRLNRNAADSVMLQVQKAKKSKSKHTKPLSASTQQKHKVVHISEPNLRNIRTGEKRTLKMFEDTDSEEEDDYLFDDILTMK